MNFFFIISSVVFSVVVLGLGSKAIHIDINPAKCIATTESAVHLSCATGSGDDMQREIAVIEISRNDEKPIAFLRECANITYGHGMEGQFQAEGHIDKTLGQGYLNLTLSNPRSEDTGIYTCVMYYLDESGLLHKETHSGDLVVEKLDVSTLETVLNQMKAKIVSLEQKNNNFIQEATKDLEKKTQQINDLNNKVAYTVAFSATNQNHMGITKGTVLIFPDIIMQVGQGYDRTTGVFTAPRHGMYVFHLVVTEHRHCSLDLDLIANDALLARMYAYDSSSSGQSSVSAVTKLKPGDRVYSFLPGDTGCQLAGNRYSVFTGYLIQPL